MNNLQKNFSLISPSNKIPAIVDKENGKNIFESRLSCCIWLQNIINLFLKNIIGKL